MERFLLKEFASFPTIQTSVYGSENKGVQQYSEDPETIQSLNAWTEGLGSATSNATKQPAINDDQGIYKVLCKAIKNGQISGIPLYLETETYQIGSIVLVIDSNNNEPILYYSKTANNIGNNPTTDSINWAKYSDIFSDDYTKIDGSNAAFDNLSQTAKENIFKNINTFNTQNQQNIENGWTVPTNGYVEVYGADINGVEVFLARNGKKRSAFGQNNNNFSVLFTTDVVEGDIITFSPEFTEHYFYPQI